MLFSRRPNNSQLTAIVLTGGLGWASANRAGGCSMSLCGSWGWQAIMKYYQQKEQKEDERRKAQDEKEQKKEEEE